MKADPDNFAKKLVLASFTHHVNDLRTQVAKEEKKPTSPSKVVNPWRSWETSRNKQAKAGFHTTDLYRILALIAQKLKTAKTMKERLNNGTPKEHELLIEIKRFIGNLFRDTDSGALLKIRQIFNNEGKISAKNFKKN